MRDRDAGVREQGHQDAFTKAKTIDAEGRKGDQAA